MDTCFIISCVERLSGQEQYRWFVSGGSQVHITGSVYYLQIMSAWSDIMDYLIWQCIFVLAYVLTKIAICMWGSLWKLLIYYANLLVGLVSNARLNTTCWKFIQLKIRMNLYTRISLYLWEEVYSYYYFKVGLFMVRSCL